MKDFQNGNNANTNTHYPRPSTHKPCLLALIILAFALSGCFNAFLAGRQPVISENASENSSETVPMVDQPSSTPPESRAAVALVTAATFSGDAGAYQVSVTIESPDLGCDQYADWWEVLDLEGNLLYRRILAHSHVDEQPFTRSGGPVAISPEQTIIIRAHMHPTGYGNQALQGSVSEGVAAIELPDNFAATVATQAPLPNGCAF